MVSPPTAPAVAVRPVMKVPSCSSSSSSSSRQAQVPIIAPAVPDLLEKSAGGVLLRRLPSLYVAPASDSPCGAVRGAR